MDPEKRKNEQDTLWSMKYNFDFEPEIIYCIGKNLNAWIAIAAHVWPQSEIISLSPKQVSTNAMRFEYADLVKIDAEIDEIPQILQCMTRYISSAKYMLVNVNESIDGWTLVKPSCFINTAYLNSLQCLFRIPSRHHK